MNKKSIENVLTENVNIQSLFITSPTTIKKLNDRYENNFWIPPFEYEEGIDWELVEDGNYTSSASQVGQIYDIIVAINEKDPYQNDNTSIYRTHLRILDGRTRYYDSKRKNTNWKVKYIKVKNFLQFIFLWSHFNSKKGGNTLDEKNKFAQLSKYMYDEMGIPRNQIASHIVSAYGDNHPFSRSKLYRILPTEIIRDYKISSSKSDKDNVDPQVKPSKKQSVINSLKIELDDKFREVIDLQTKVRDLTEQKRKWEDLEPFLTTPQIVTTPSGFKITVSFDLDKKEIKIE